MASRLAILSNEASLTPSICPEIRRLSVFTPMPLNSTAKRSSLLIHGISTEPLPENVPSLPVTSSSTIGKSPAIIVSPTFKLSIGVLLDRSITGASPQCGLWYGSSSVFVTCEFTTGVGFSTSKL